MTGEEKSRWFFKYLDKFNGHLDYDKMPQHRKDTYKMMVEEDIMPYLHSQGVVIKIPVAPPIGGSAKMCCYEELIG